MSAAAPLGIRLYRPLEAEPGTLRFKLFHLGRPGDAVRQPADARAHGAQGDRRAAASRGAATPTRPSGCTISACSRAVGGDDEQGEGLGAVFEDAFGRIFRGEVENDDFNRLVVAARLPATEIVVLRAYAKYLRQIGFALSQSFIESTLAANAGIARELVGLFNARFDPDAGPEADARAAAHVQAIEAALDHVDNLSDDRVLRQFLALILATTRTNFWRCDAAGRRRSFLSFKFDPAKVPGLPEPRPMFEIFVYSPRFEGVHLRGGKVARGGLRWSDRAGGFPHRGPRPRQGADGEEHRHRAGGIEGWIRAEARAVPDRARRLPEGRGQPAIRTTCARCST